MSRSCDISGLGVLSGNNVSHSNRKTRRRFLPNLQKVTLVSDSLNSSFQMRIATKTLRSIEARGGLDSYLLSISATKLTDKAAKLKQKIKRTLGKDNEKVS